MPFYEYQCSKCGHEEEVLQKITDKPLKKCPECGKLAMKKMVSAAAFRLKGGGWYETDFKSGPKKNLDEKNVAGEAHGDSKAADNKNKTRPDIRAPAKKKAAAKSTGVKKAKS